MWWTAIARFVRFLNDAFREVVDNFRYLPDFLFPKGHNMATIKKVEAPKQSAFARIKAARKSRPKMSVELPPMNTHSGRFIYDMSTRKSDDDISRYRVDVALIADESPIKRFEISLFDVEANQRKSSIRLPVLALEMLLRDQGLVNLLQTMQEVLKGAGEKPSRYRIPRR